MFSVALLLLLAAGSCVKCEQLTQPGSVTVQPGQRLSITCQVSYSVSSHHTAWIRQPAGKGLEWLGIIWSDGNTAYASSVRGRIEITRDTSNNILYVRLSNSQPEDSAVYYCANHYYAFDYWGKGTTVTVTSATPTAPTVFPLAQCDTGDSAMITLGCLATGFTPSSLTFSWTKNGAAVTDFIQYPAVLKDNVYSGVTQLRIRRQDWNPNEKFQCVATYPSGTAQAPVTFTPRLYQLPTLKVCSSSDEEGEVSFSCVAKDFSPSTHELKWLKNGNEITGQKDMIRELSGKITGDNGTLFSTSSVLTVQSAEWTNGVTFTCLFEGKGENNTPVHKNASLTNEDGRGCEGCKEADVEIVIIDPSVEDMFVKRKGNLTCQVKINKGTIEKILWQDENEGDMADASMVPTKGKKGPFNLSLDITYDEWAKGTKRYCVVESQDWFDPLKKIYQRKIGGQPQRPSVFMLPPVEHTRKDTVTLTCYLKDFFPQDVFVSWLVDDNEADSKYEFNTTQPVKSNGFFSAYSQLSVTLAQWERRDVVYSCLVYHESMGNSSKTIVRSTGCRTGDKTNLVNLNMNVPDTCKA